MNQYELTLKGYEDCPSIIAIGETAAKAKYQAWLSYADIFESFRNFLMRVQECRKLPLPLGAVADEAFQRVIAFRGIPFAHIGMRVETLTAENKTLKQGTIVGGNPSCNLNVWLDGEAGPSNCHPLSNIRYLDGGGHIIAQFTSTKEE